MRPNFKSQSQRNIWDVDTYKGLVFCRNNGWIMENMDKGLTVPKWVLIIRPKIPQMPQNLSAQFVCPNPKVWDFDEKKASLGVRSPWLWWRCRIIQKTEYYRICRLHNTYLQGQGHLHLVIAILYVKVVTGVFTKTYVYMLQIRVHQSFLTVFRVLLLINVWFCMLVVKIVNYQSV